MKTLTAQSSIYSHSFNPNGFTGSILLEFDGKSERFPFEVIFPKDGSVAVFIYRNEKIFFISSVPENLLPQPLLTDGEMWLASMMHVVLADHIIKYVDDMIPVLPPIDVVPENPETNELVSSVLENDQRDKRIEN